MASLSRPVTAFFEQKLLALINEKKLVVWLDAEATYTAFVDALRAAPAPFSVLVFHGSFLELMLELEPVATTLDRPVLLVHLPGFNRDTVVETPVLELYETAYPLQLNLSSLVRDAANGLVPLAEIDRFLAEPGLSLDSANAWLGRVGTA